MPSPYTVRDPWNSSRPGTLVIACSDGRLQEPLDEFLASRGVSHYDRLYVPGGPGALASSGVSYVRADEFRRECAFLIVAHAVADVYLIFHGPAEDGPALALCADYTRKLPTYTPGQIRVQQQRDLEEVLRNGFGWNVSARIHAFRCEVTGAGAVQFATLEARLPSAASSLSLSAG